ncbi:hypothetical protein [Rhodococcoides corynebacterioides]|uniref:Ig-like domain-containing protein n=1 Tax=Rhodococcoides corynebacterioides TaxID=53972 RepID=A0ABS7P8G6_9NOCA|nr:hypothetical protein [Rhodococcus corynebacterioides]MBY6368715.1 hypothetical protein [Rhodococcus corynebacterioides]MBY6409754.1 hypothetical protein [Rhodococcus corynebacterioides]
MTVRSRTLGRAGIVVAAAAAGVLATSGTASAAVLTVQAVPTPGVESISTALVVAGVFVGTEVECTVTATEVDDDTNTASATDTLLTVLAAATGTIDIDGLEPGIYTVTASCTDGGDPVDALIDLPITVLPDDLPPVVPPVPGGGSLPTDLFES